MGTPEVKRTTGFDPVTSAALAGMAVLLLLSYIRKFAERSPGQCRGLSRVDLLMNLAPCVEPVIRGSQAGVDAPAG